MAGNKRIVSGRIAQGKLRGRALADALDRDLNHDEDVGAKGNEKV